MKNQNIILGFITLVLVSSCYKETFVASGEGLDDWTIATHSSIAPINYDVVFPQDKVNRFDITISSDNWEAMQSDVEALYGSSNTSAGGPGVGGPPPMGGGGSKVDENPIYIPCNLEFNGVNWYNVGIRYKGNSSLKAYSNGVKKLPFRLEFSEFEDDYTEIKGQTFYGFPALSMSSNYNDKSFDMSFKL